jgi:hypothetical protein
MKNYVGLRGASSPRDRLFACPADIYYYDTAFGERHPRPDYEEYVPESWCVQSNSDYTSYVFNAGNLFGPTKKVALPGIAGMTLSSIKHPSRAVLVTEAPALIPFSWHQPRRLLFTMMRSGIGCRTKFFNEPMNMVSFVDGHVSYVKMYWKPSTNCPQMTQETLIHVHRLNPCHRSLQNQPAGVESKPATLRCFIHIRFLDARKGLARFVSGGTGSSDHFPMRPFQRGLMRRNAVGRVCSLLMANEPQKTVAHRSSGVRK